jgi:hypothetical protein
VGEEEGEARERFFRPFASSADALGELPIGGLLSQPRLMDPMIIIIIIYHHHHHLLLRS